MLGNFCSFQKNISGAPCAGPGFFTRRSRTDSQKTAPTIYFTVLQRVSNGYFKENYIFQGFRGGSTFSKGGSGPTFSRGGGGVQVLISIETHITCDFPGGLGYPIPPLDPHMNTIRVSHVWIQIRPDVLSGLIWVETVCKDYPRHWQTWIKI